MPSQSLHEEQGRHNEALRKSLPDTHPDWEITVMFYAALHYLRAALATRGDRYTGRDLRYDLLTLWLEAEGMGALSDPFDTLRTLSYKTRYECKGTAWAYSEMTRAELALSAVKRGVSAQGVAVL